jgi:quercetin dioxygenase-like cupin family protein/alkylhydroperoxidase/carboxymuconolactone decarboxylase family protein YurZ
MRKNIILIGLIIALNHSLCNLNAQNKMNTNPELTARQLSIIPIAGFSAKGEIQNLKSALNDGLDAGLSINEIKEILVHLYAYAGFPRSLNAINTFESVLKERKQKGIKDVIGRDPSPQNFENGKFKFGKDVQTTLTGSTATGAAQQFVPIIDTFLKEHLFADIFGRDNLDYQNREIVTVSVLASLSGTENQLQSHLKVCKNIGFNENQLRQIAFTITNRIGRQEGSTVIKILDDMYGVHTANSEIQSNGLPIQKISNTIFSKGKIIQGNNFSGAAWLNWLVPNDSIFNCPVGNVTFEPGARTNWHKHPGGQILLVTDGEGYYQERGKAVQSIKKGDVILIGPDIEHWHGATSNSMLTHISINTNVQKGSAVWLQTVTEEEYSNLKVKY